MSLSDAPNFTESSQQCTVSTIFHFQVTSAVLVSSIFSCFLDVVNILISIPGNLLVILAIYRNSFLHHNADYVLLMLAVSDFLVSSLLQPMLIVFKIEHLLNKPRCATVILLTAARAISLHAAIISQMVVGLERTVAVMAPFWYQQWVSPTRLFAALICVWLVWTTFHLSSFFKVVPYVIVMKVYLVFVAVCLLVTAVSYGLLVKIANRHENQVQAQQQQVQRSEEEKKKQKRERKALWTALYINGAYLVGYLPLILAVILNATVNLSPTQLFHQRSWVPTFCCLVAGVNPVILSWRKTHLGREMKKLLGFGNDNNQPSP